MKKKWPNTQSPARSISPFFPRSFQQLLNLIKLSSSLGTSLLSRRAVTWGTPVVAHIEPTSLCNLHCPLCPSGNSQLTRNRSRMDFDTFKTIIDKLPETIRMLLLWNQGEPFMVREFIDMLRYARRRQLYLVTSTNGHFFNNIDQVQDLIRSGINEIIISLDGTTQESYQKYRIGGDLDRVFHGIQNLGRIKRELQSPTPIIHLQFILMRHNLHQKKEIQILGRKYGADRLSFKTLQVTGFENGKDFLPDDPVFTRYSGRSLDGQYITRKRAFFPNDCLRLWYSLVVNCDGTVSPCCFDKDGDYVLGNLVEQAFEQIWRGENYQNFRQRLLDFRMEQEMCRDCTEGLKNVFPETVIYQEHRQPANRA